MGDCNPSDLGLRTLTFKVFIEPGEVAQLALTLALTL